MNRLSDNLLRKELNLEKRWWHRLTKIFFVIFSVVILISSISGFYSAEESSARRYRIIKNFGEYIQEVKTDCATQKVKTDSNTPRTLDDLSCYLFIIPSFLQENTLKDYSLGCLLKNGRIEYLSEFSFKSFEGGATCTSDPDSICTIPKNICGGVASSIVKYDYEIRYGFYNYFSIAIKTLGVFLGWILLIYLIYYKALLYIIFGGKEHTGISNNH